MRFQLNILIEAGAATCASEPGKFCRFVGSKNFGQAHVCMLFPSEEGGHTRLEDAGGWLQRLPECLAASSRAG